MFEQVFKNIDDVLRKEAGCTTELDYTEQTSWILFLKYLDELEADRKIDAELRAVAYTPIIDAAHRWEVWAAPKDATGKFDHNRAKTGDDLIDYVNRELFPYLQQFKARAASSDTIEYKIGEIFGEIKNRFGSGYSLRDALELIDGLSFRSQDQKHELSHLYEAKIKNMGNAGRNGGEYYTPRPLIRAMIQVVKPRIGQKIYDGAVGSAGFLCEAYDYLKPLAKSTSDNETLQKRTFYGKEKKSLAYVIAIMNMILHGIDAPNIIHTNTLGEAINDIQEKDRYDVILANPPFGGKERPEIQQNFNIKTGETAFLFLQHFIKSLRAGGTAAIVIKNTFLSNGDNASVALRKELLENCNLHTILDMPGGTFQGAGVKTVVLFFEKGEATRNIWYYQLDPGRNMGKTNPLNDNDMAEFLALQASFMPKVNREHLFKYSVWLPDVAAQREIGIRLDNLTAKCQKMADTYQRQITALAELKQSLLQKAFAGELTAAVAAPLVQRTNVNYATPQFTAQIVAFAQRLHEKRGTQQTFGHVKTQKALHLVESVGCIDLGRQPIRDAAGPNDFQHMLRATDWAAQHGFFEFTPRAGGKGYDFNKLANYDALWAEAETATQPVSTELCKAINLVVNSDSDFAELIATTHAAWNNLIIDKAEITDDTIVLASRDNWHASKLRHDPSRFHDAIRFIKANGIVPDGSAKYVGGQVSLF